ncbi:MAG: hypothetical protein ACI9HK_002386 [Pirellulaceae bacterium]|jgi:hypothetical protein
MYPHERSLVTKLSDKPFALLGINSDDDLVALRKTVVEERINWRSWSDDASDGTIHTNWQVVQRPTVHLLDATGVIRYKNLEPEAIDDAIDKLLAEMPSKRE